MTAPGTKDSWTTLAVPALALALTLGHAQLARADDWFGADKGLHFGVSAGLGAGGYAAGSLAFENRAPRLLFGVGIGVAAGAGKELYDAAGHGDPSWRDFSWDVLGALTGATIAWLIDELVIGEPPRSQATAIAAQKAASAVDP